MADIFGRNVSTLAGVFTADQAKLVMTGNLGVLVQQMQFSYQQTITRLYEVGANGPNNSSNIYYVGGRTAGSLMVSRVIGPSGSVAAMYTQFGNVCNAPHNTLTFTLTQTDCSAANSATGVPNTYTLLNCVIQAVSVQVASQDMIIGENTQMIYSSLSVSGAAAGSSVSGLPLAA